MDETKSHCSSHVYWMNGCAECSVSDELAEKKKADTKLYKKAIQPLRIDIGKTTANPKTQLIRQQLSRVFAVFFAKSKDLAAVAAGKEARKLQKITKEEEQKIALAAYAAIKWGELVDGVYLDLLAAAQAGIEEGINQLGSVPVDDKESLLTEAEVYAKERAAEMIGKQYIDNKLLDDPNARWVIAETTKDDLADIVTQATEKELSIEELEKMIRLAGTFSDARAQMIAQNETALAQTKLHLNTWKTFGIQLVNVVLSDRHAVVDECDLLVAKNPWPIANAPVIPNHVNCECCLIGLE